MAVIKIHDELVATPKEILIPDNNMTKLSFDASGPGDVEIEYSISPNSPVRFIENQVSKSKLQHSAKLMAFPKTITRKVRICHLDKQKLKGIFIITAIVRKRDQNNNITDYQKTRCACSYKSKKGSETCV